MGKQCAFKLAAKNSAITLDEGDRKTISKRAREVETKLCQMWAKVLELESTVFSCRCKI